MSFQKKLNNSNKKIFLKNFFLFLIILKKNPNFEKINFFVKPKKNKNFVVLRAPYRYKLAKLQLTIKRYIVNVCFVVKLQTNADYYTVKNKLKKINNISSNFETTFMHNHKINLKYLFKNKKNFLMSTFNVNF